MSARGAAGVIVKTRITCLVGLAVTLAVIHLLQNSLVILLVLLCLWAFLFTPWSRTDLIVFVIASVFFVGQNYAVLKSGGFSFSHQDFLLMPYYEPFLWGFYFLNIKRFLSEQPGSVIFEKKSVLGLLATGIGFSLFSSNSGTTLVATSISTALLFIMFHQPADLICAGYSLCLGLIVELFGVSTGLWSYPEPDIWGIPFWFVTMWLSVGLLGRRFLFPLSETLVPGS